MTKKQTTSLLAYIPVLHEGYRAWLSDHTPSTLYLLDKDITDQYRPLVKDIRALPPALIKKSLESWGLELKVKIVNESILSKMDKKKESLVAPREDITELVVEKYLPNNVVVFENIFLRWDRRASLAKQAVETKQEITTSQLSQKLMKQAFDQAKRSGDWWRQIGGLIAKNGEVLLTAYNRHVPYEQQPYIEGDARANFKKGVRVEISTALHVEASLIAQAAKNGISLEGTHMYTTTFPCPFCAKTVAFSGIKRLYFSEGYSMIDGQRIMEQAGIEIVRVR